MKKILILKFSDICQIYKNAFYRILSDLLEKYINMNAPVVPQNVIFDTR